LTTTTTTGTPAIDIAIPTIDRIQKVVEGLKFIITHFDPTSDNRPRTISTYKTGGKQIVVNNFEEAMTRFKAAKFYDCRISAYPVYNDEYIKRTGLRLTSSLLLCDLDKEHFRTAEEFEATAKKTLLNFRKILGSTPTQLWTGSGYHFLQPQSAIALETIEDFNQFAGPSRKFLQFEEWLMTDGKADQNHNRTVSFKNCMLRIPGSLNFGACQRNDRDEIIGIPPEAEVRIIQHWDGNRPSANHLIPRCYMWLKAAEIKDMQRRIEADKISRYKSRKYYQRPSREKRFQWIENLLNKPIHDHRYYCTWRIFAPYLINVRGLSKQEAFNIIQTWLVKCSYVKRLNFPTEKVNDVLNGVGDFYPIARLNLEHDNKLLFELLKNEGVIY